MKVKVKGISIMILNYAVQSADPLSLTFFQNDSGVKVEGSA